MSQGAPNDTMAALGRVIDETRALFHRLKRTAEMLHVDDEVSAGERAVLVELARQGPRTVPEMARARPVSRQHIQSLVNSLLDRSLVELTPNPRHRTSRLVRLTPDGARLVSTITTREDQVLAGLASSLSRGELEQTANTLASLGKLLQDDSFARLVERTRRRGRTGSPRRRTDAR